MEFFGLGKVNLSEISHSRQKKNRPKNKNPQKQNHKNKKNKQWYLVQVLLFIITAVAGLVFLYYNYGKSG